MTDHTIDTETTESTEMTEPTETTVPTETGAGDSAEWPVLDEPLGPATITIDVPRAVARQAWQAYRQAARGGYAEGFDTFLMNHTSAEYTITVDGVALATVLAREDLAGDGDETGDGPDRTDSEREGEGMNPGRHDDREDGQA